ncbi:phospholipid transport system substrate-binding protein [Formivibrio citricus]|uniref:Phospholipid transport system substrate-binding protein n=1 Tax=Formivibrio citricus TaxID=83765 RepID=A0A1I5DCG9_9NEIS|nr:ABC transporter substrate-binding protein [Formivibrio citricus]SFN96890.1 phospholipid transport system substrate-binding protein [Formivibrio citricus]
MKSIKFWFVAMSLALVAGSSVAAPADAPEQIVRSVSRDVLEIIRKNDKDSARVRDQVDARVAPLANYNRMTALAVGRHWRNATPEQQQALVREFRQMLVRTYLSALTIYKNARVDVKGSRGGNSSDELDVRTEVFLPGQKPIPLDFSFEKTSAGWKVYDIAVDGISFINNHRNQFNAIVQKEGIDGLIKNLSGRNAAARGNKVASKR